MEVPNDGARLVLAHSETEGEEILEFTPTATKDNQDDPYGPGPGAGTDGGAMDGAADASDGTGAR